ncbi:MAG TPA: Asp23/Gls24 family envelope stress response protein [Firmicutes bacterium]|nr:Asp23/Gls24 family envelope stress response protein [Bacillota bacterium]
MPYEIENKRGKVIWTEEAVASLVAAEAGKCEGLVDMAPRGVGEGLADLLGREHSSRGVEISFQGGKASITLNIVVGYGVKIPQLAREVAAKVREAVVDRTGVPVGAVKVNVQGVRARPDRGE